MNTRADKSQGNKNRSVANHIGQKRNSNGSASQLLGYRPDGVSQNGHLGLLHNSSPGLKAVQLKKLADNYTIQQHQPIQKKSNDTGLPDQLKEGVEQQSGISLDDVKVHYNSSKPAELNAYAYAQGANIHVAPGQQKHLPHEAWHVVQQKQGRVKPTGRLGNISINDDRTLEKEADEMGAIAQTKLAEVSSNTTRSVKKGSIQMKTDESAIIQMLQTSTSIKADYGFPSPEKGKQWRYKNVLKAIDDFHGFRNSMTLGNTAVDIATSFNELQKKYDEVYDQIEVYLKGKTKAKKAAKERKKFMKELQAQIIKEKAHAQHAGKILSDALKHEAKTLQVSDETEIKGGALNKVFKHAEGFFKENHETLPNRAELDALDHELTTVSAEKQEWIEKGRALGSEDKLYKGEPVTESLEEINRKKVERINRENELSPRFKFLDTVVDISEAAGIAPDYAHTAKRDIASARLDSLLGGGIIARAEYALQINGQSTKEGVLMEEAQGEAIGDIGKDDRVVKNKNQKGAGKLYIKDPEFMRQLSRLQLLDTLAFQVDRNFGNFFVLLDAKGNVVKVTGIDNDMSFGGKTNIHNAEKQYPGLSKYVDEDMALSILALDEKVLELTLTGLILQNEIDAFILRLRKLKAHLKVLKRKGTLLKPKQWNDAIVKKLLIEDKSYFSTLHKEE